MVHTTSQEAMLHLELLVAIGGVCKLFQNETILQANDDEGLQGMLHT